MPKGGIEDSRGLTWNRWSRGDTVERARRSQPIVSTGALEAAPPSLRMDCTTAYISSQSVGGLMAVSPVDGSAVLRAGLRWRFVGLAGMALVALAVTRSDFTSILASVSSFVSAPGSFFILRVARGGVTWGTDTVVVRFRFCREIEDDVTSGITSSISGLGP